MKSLVVALYEAYLGWLLEGRHFVNVNSGCRYLGLDGMFYSYWKEDWIGPYDTMHEWTGYKPSVVHRLIKRKELVPLERS